MIAGEERRRVLAGLGFDPDDDDLIVIDGSRRIPAGCFAAACSVELPGMRGPTTRPTGLMSVEARTAAVSRCCDIIAANCRERANG
jgi:hypothetical protein